MYGCKKQCEQNRNEIRRNNNIKMNNDNVIVVIGKQMITEINRQIHTVGVV